MQLLGGSHQWKKPDTKGNTACGSVCIFWKINYNNVKSAQEQAGAWSKGMDLTAEGCGGTFYGKEYIIQTGVVIIW
jgi:hypothetical protein